MQRGAIHSRERAKQLRDFSKMRWGNITPTDNDCMLDFKNKLTVIAESKIKGEELPYGQRLALERMCDDIQRCKPCYLLIVEHEVYNPEDDIDFAETIVAEYRYNGNKHFPKKPIKLKRAIDIILKKHEIN